MQSTCTKLDVVLTCTAPIALDVAHLHLDKMWHTYTWTRCGTLTLGLDVARRLWPAGGSGPPVTIAQPHALLCSVTTYSKCAMVTITRASLQCTVSNVQMSTVCIVHCRSNVRFQLKYYFKLNSPVCGVSRLSKVASQPWLLKVLN